jgi:PKD repeat protein
MIAILFAIDLTTIANAQQPQQQQPSNQTATIENGTLFQSTMDNFRVHVPQGWVIQDVNNTGSTLEAEVLQGYGVLAQLCPEGEEQQAAPDMGGNGTVGSTFSSMCQESEGNVVDIVRHLNLSATVGFTRDDYFSDHNNTANAILAYQLQKLQEVGYRDILIVNSTDTAIKVDLSTSASDMIDNDNINAIPPSIRVPAKLVQMTYSTASSAAPNEIRTGYYLLTATSVASPNPDMITGYGVFYEDNSTATAAAETTTPSASLAPTPLPAPAREVFDSFELIASEEAVQAILAAIATQAQQLGQVQQLVTVQTVQTGVIGETISPLSGTLNANDTEGVAPATFKFDTDIRGGIEPYAINWDFDDGSQERDKETVVHTFDEAGTYTVTMTVIDSAGQVGAASIGIAVEDPIPDNPLPDNNTSSEDPIPDNPLPDNNTSSEEEDNTSSEEEDNTSSEDPEP